MEEDAHTPAHRNLPYPENPYMTTGYTGHVPGKKVGQTSHDLLFSILANVYID